MRTTNKPERTIPIHKPEMKEQNSESVIIIQYAILIQSSIMHTVIFRFTAVSKTFLPGRDELALCCFISSVIFALVLCITRGY